MKRDPKQRLVEYCQGVVGGLDELKARDIELTDFETRLRTELRSILNDVKKPTTRLVNRGGPDDR